MSQPAIPRLVSFLVLAGSACSRAPASAPPAGAGSTAPVVVEARLIEAACGTCKFDLPGSDCALAVRIDGRAYYVDGTKIDDLGDAHAADGICNVVRQARVSGRLDGERFASTAFELLPAAR
jgi:hypothetical protein